MPILRRGKASAEIFPNAMVASAKNFKAKGPAARIKPIKQQSWQIDAWTWYDNVAEYRYGCQWVGNLLSRARLIVNKDGKPTKDQAAVDLLESLFGGSDNHPEFLRQSGIHMTVAGEYFVFGTTGSSGDDEWQIAASVEVSHNTQGWKVGGEQLDEDPLAIRIWRPHPRKGKWSDSPTRPLLLILAEIDGLTKHVAAQIDSRLAGAGILLLPSEMTFPGKVESGGGTQAFAEAITEVMMQAIEDRGSAEALTPFVLQGPADSLKEVRHVTTSTALDETARALREEAIRRLATGMDMPPEVLLGTSDMNHWGAWQMEEAAIKSHTEPLLEIITQSATVGYLRPLLIAEGMEPEEAARYEIAADTSLMRLRPNRSKEALELYDRGELNAVTLLRENGFDDNDAMGKEEFTQWLLKRTAGGTTTPDAVEAALKKLGVALQIAPREGEEGPDDGDPARPIRSLREHPRHQEPEENDGLAAGAEVLVFRALEKAGNRLKTKGHRVEGVPAAELYLHTPVSKETLDFILTDVWAGVERFEFGMESDDLVTRLDSYVRVLITQQQEHRQDFLRSYLSLPRGNR